MKLLIILSTLVVLISGQETYNTEHDDMDIDKILNNPEKLREWLDCFVDKGPCDKVQSTFKADFPEAVQQACKKCSAAQKIMVKKFLAKVPPADFGAFQKKFDPENKYFVALIKAVE